MESENINQDDNIYLCQNYNWFYKNFLPEIQKATDDFFGEDFQVILLSVSKNINIFMEKTAYFVTKIKIDDIFDIFCRLSEESVGMVLDKSLGNISKKFKFNRITDLEAKVITSFNDCVYNAISKNMIPPPPTIKRTNFDVINLTFLIKDKELDNCSKFIITIPITLLNPESVVSKGEKFSNTTFATSMIDAKIKVGSTRFSVYDLKNIEVDDIVVFENSTLEQFELHFKDYENVINIKPNLGLVLPINNDEEANKMSDNKPNIWDSIEVDMNAQFDPIKISLGELKNIEEGLVIDLARIYDNKVTLSVENKTIATGELIIINDKYGVRVDSVVADNGEIIPNNSNNEISTEENTSEVSFENDENTSETAEGEDEDENLPLAEGEESQAKGENEEDFDYSDFELEDEDI